MGPPPADLHRHGRRLGQLGLIAALYYIGARAGAHGFLAVATVVFIAVLWARIVLAGRHQAEAALRQVVTELADAQRLAHVGSFRVDTCAGTIGYWSDELYRILGLDPAA